MANLNVKRQVNVNNNDEFLKDILTGFSERQKRLPCKYFYDERGSHLFDEICKTEEYYHTRTELKILDDALPTIAGMIGPNADILEFGSGAGIKIRKLIDALETPRSYCPIDISEEILLHSSRKLKKHYPELLIHPIVADYLSPIDLHDTFATESEHRKLVFFPGSTISNFDLPEAIHFLKHIRSLLTAGDVLLIGVDLLKPEPILLAAYNDRTGVTAAFNRNILDRIAATYQTNLEPGLFCHRAIYNAEKHRIEMHLVSTCEQTVEVEGESFHFRKLESIHTENSYKFSLEGFRMMGMNAGFDQTAVFTDEESLFSVHYLTAH